MSVVINSHLIDNGVKIKFRTINTYDNNLWVGYVEGIVTYSMARALSDVNKLHEEVLKDTLVLVQLKSKNLLSYLRQTQMTMGCVSCLQLVGLMNHRWKLFPRVLM